MGRFFPDEEELELVPRANGGQPAPVLEPKPAQEQPSRRFLEVSRRLESVEALLADGWVPEHLRPPPANVPRAFNASAERIFAGSSSERVDKREPSAWQTAAWQFVDAIGEVKFASSVLGSILSRVRLYAGVVDDIQRSPVSVTVFLEELDPAAGITTGDVTAEALRYADEIVSDIREQAYGGTSTLMRNMAVNIWVAGEFYLIRDNKWRVASVSELTKGTGKDANFELITSRGGKTPRKPIPADAFVARIWRNHSRWSGEADSSMLGVLDQCEELVLLEQAKRVITRSRLNAGALFVPDGVGTVDLEKSLFEAANGPIRDESAASTIVPLLLQGPAELGKEIKLIDLSRRVDENVLEQESRVIDRMLSGLDIPKEFVTGLSGVKFANAVSIDDELFRSHVEPLALLIVDSLTQVVLRPSMRARGIPEEVINQCVVWYDPSTVISRPDKSQAANDGFDRKILSAKAWRSARGFTEFDAPDEDELIRRLALEKAMIPPEMATVLVESLNPPFFAAQRAHQQELAGMPDDISQLLEGGTMPSNPGENPPPAPPGPPGQPEPGDEIPPGRPEANPMFQGGEIQPGGVMPPRPSRR